MRIPRWVSYIGNIPFNDKHKGWVRRVPLLPHFTIDGHLIWLWPAWHRFVPSTDWEGSNWSYEWAALKSTVD